MDEGPHTIHRTTDEARGGSTPHVVRWMLGIGLFAVIALLSAIWIFSAATQDDPVDAPVSEVETSGGGMMPDSATPDAPTDGTAATSAPVAN